MPDAELPKLPRVKRGPKPLMSSERRLHTVSVRLNLTELAELDSARAGVKMQRGEYLRAASRGVLPPTIPSINREAWAELAKVAGNLNQYQAAIIEGKASGYPSEVIESLHELVQKLRSELLGLDEKEEISEAENEGQD
jgi:hypothetical protein